MDALTKWSKITAAKTRPRLSLKRVALLGLACILVLAASGYGYYWWTVDRFFQSTDDAYVGGDVTPIAPHIAGFIAEIPVGTMSLSTPGNCWCGWMTAMCAPRPIMPKRCSTSAQQRWLVCEPNMTCSNRPSGRRAPISMPRARRLIFAKVDAERYRTLAVSNSGSRQDAERTSALDQQARATVASAQAALAAAKQQLSVLDADITGAAAAVAQARADLETARLNLGYAEIRAPIDGYVGNRAAQVGAYVSQGAHLLTISPGAWFMGRRQFQGRPARTNEARAAGDDRRRHPP